MAIDFKAVAAAAVREAAHLVPRWLRDGRVEGNEWVAVNPNRPGSDGSGAFRVNLHTGAWADFAGTDKGGDLISLLAYIRGIGQAEACRLLAAELGIDAAGHGLRVVEGGGAPAAAARPREADAELVAPVPADAPPYAPMLSHFKLGAAAAHWEYRDAAGRLLMVVARWNTPTATDPAAKEILPLTLRRRGPGGLMLWRYRGLPEPRPLYRLDELARRPTATAIVCEGEKAADAAQQLLPDFVATTSPNGCKSAGKADWTPLGGRRVLIWPDHDANGYLYANAVRAELLDAGAVSVQVLSFAWMAKALAAAHGGDAA